MHYDQSPGTLCPVVGYHFIHSIQSTLPKRFFNYDVELFPGRTFTVLSDTSQSLPAQPPDISPPTQSTFLTKQLSNDEFINISIDEWSQIIAPNSRILRYNLKSSFADLKIKNKSIQEIDCNIKMGSHLNFIYLKVRLKVLKIFIAHVFYILRIFTSEIIDIIYWNTNNEFKIYRTKMKYRSRAKCIPLEHHVLPLVTTLFTLFYLKDSSIMT